MYEGGKVSDAGTEVAGWVIGDGFTIHTYVRTNKDNLRRFSG